MKNLFYCLLLLLIVPLIASCSNDDEPEMVIAEPNITGIWRAVSYHRITIGKNIIFVNNEMKYVDRYDVEPNNEFDGRQIFFIFRPDHTYVTNVSGFTSKSHYSTGIWKLEGDSITGIADTSEKEIWKILDMKGHLASVKYTAANGEMHMMDVILPGIHGEPVTKEELESAPSFMYVYSEEPGGYCYVAIKFRDGHLYVKQYGMEYSGVPISDAWLNYWNDLGYGSAITMTTMSDIRYNLSGYNITLEYGWQKRRGRIYKVWDENGRMSIIMEFGAPVGVGSLLSKPFKWADTTFEYEE